MKLKYLFLIQICFLLIVIGSASSVNAQRKENSCRNCAVAVDHISKDEIVCVSSKQLKKRIVFINELKPPPSVSLTKIKDKTVFIDIIVNNEGKVIKALASKGHPALKPVGVAIANNAKFSPIEIDSKQKYMCGTLILKWNPEK